MSGVYIKYKNNHKNQKNRENLFNFPTYIFCKKHSGHTFIVTFIYICSNILY